MIICGAICTTGMILIMGLSQHELVGTSAWLRWSVFRPKLVLVARVENVRWLLRLLGEN